MSTNSGISSTGIGAQAAGGLGDGYRVHLSAFEGPLDLLLFLIRKHEVDIHDIPIAQIAEQFVSFLMLEAGAGGLARLDIDEAGEFLVMAAMLMEIKSRMLLPEEHRVQRTRTGEGEKEASDPRAELVRQLLEYKRLRDAADTLERLGTTWQARHPGKRAGVDNASLDALLAAQSHESDIEDLHLADLVSAFARIASTVNFDRLGEHEVAYDDTPQEVHQQEIVRQLEAAGVDGERPLRAVLAVKTRGEMVGLFLALLELVRGGRVAFRHDAESGEILLRAREAGEEQAVEDQAEEDQAGDEQASSAAADA